MHLCEDEWSELLNHYIGLSMIPTCIRRSWEYGHVLSLETRQATAALATTNLNLLDHGSPRQTLNSHRTTLALLILQRKSRAMADQTK